MKYLVTALLLLVSFTVSSQENDADEKGFFYKISLATTLTINEDFTIGNDDGETFINPSALFINNTFGIQWDERSSVGLNIEYDWHSKQGLHFLPVYISYRYNLLVFEDNFFLRGGYGKLVNISKDFENGSLYKVGLGFQLFNDDYEHSFLLGLDFSRKRYGRKQLEKISSVSIFLEYFF